MQNSDFSHLALYSCIRSPGASVITSLISSGQEHLQSWQTLRTQLHVTTGVYEKEQVNKVYKFLTGKERVDPELFFHFGNQQVTRGHCYKLAVPLAKSTVRRNSFSVRTVNKWNSLSEVVVEAESVNAFKSSPPYDHAMLPLGAIFSSSPKIHHVRKSAFSPPKIQKTAQLHHGNIPEDFFYTLE
ncbi:hypothetical protein Bbelb_258250 [Branchiostoma belcheri]|nr:hypothetical protein Bbelb_258250 [Branchiostoma belcheri]